MLAVSKWFKASNGTVTEQHKNMMKYRNRREKNMEFFGEYKFCLSKMYSFLLLSIFFGLNCERVEKSVS